MRNSIYWLVICLFAAIFFTVSAKHFTACRRGGALLPSKSIFSPTNLLHGLVNCKRSKYLLFKCSNTSIYKRTPELQVQNLIWLDWDDKFWCKFALQNTSIGLLSVRLRCCLKVLWCIFQKESFFKDKCSLIVKIFTNVPLVVLLPNTTPGCCAEQDGQVHTMHWKNISLFLFRFQQKIGAK